MNHETGRSTGGLSGIGGVGGVCISTHTHTHERLKIFLINTHTHTHTLEVIVSNKMFNRIVRLTI